MTIELANKILDRIRDGAIYPPHVVDEALKATGDLEIPIY
tara:strand:- start:164 stop:283 length:120 start_codon:yes stop_codon:yes gene_type:complete